MNWKKVIKVVVVISVILIALYMYMLRVVENEVLIEERDYYKEHSLNFCELAQSEAESIKILHDTARLYSKGEFDSDINFTEKILAESFCKEFIIDN